MKFLTLAIALLSINTAIAAPPHLDLEMTSKEYATLLKRRGLTSEKDDPAVAEGLRLGLRLSKWIAKINQSRSESSSIRLTSAQTRRGIPIDRPNIYSPETIKKETEELLKVLPEEMKTILLNNVDLPSDLHLDDPTFILHALRIDKNYQSAARYKSLIAYRSSYISAANKDVRGYHYLHSQKIGKNELRDVSLIDPAKLEGVKEALIGICFNSTSNRTKCQNDLTRAHRNNNLASFYTKYISLAEVLWKEFFQIPSYGKRSDITWSENTARVPFNHPEIERFIPYLQKNIEDEYRWEGWKLELVFGEYENGPVLVFEEGVVPHVNGLGGNQIVMDSNQPIEEYESQWVIRHEFGHVLGLPDCYHEFYDVTLKAFVNYQLDTTDLMCSRAGNMNERIYLELKKAYAKNRQFISSDKSH
jgi:hypothetical protein